MWNVERKIFKLREYLFQYEEKIYYLKKVLERKIKTL